MNFTLLSIVFLSDSLTNSPPYAPYHSLWPQKPKKYKIALYKSQKTW